MDEKDNAFLRRLEDLIYNDVLEKKPHLTGEELRLEVEARMERVADNLFRFVFNFCE